MAGDWIKMRVDLSTSPKVVRIASALRADRLRIVGGLHAVWCLFDVHSADGQLHGYTLEALDELIGFPGFASAMVSVGWLEDHGESLCTPRFDEHNGQSAKRRAMETQRKREVRKVSAPDADKMRSREEKRREDISTAKAVESAPKKRAAKRCPEEFDLNDAMRDWAVENAPAVDVDLATAKFKDHTFKTGITDWKAAWRNWLRNEQSFHGSRPASNAPARQSFAERDEKRKADRMAQFMGLSLTDEHNVIDVTPGHAFLEIDQ